MIISVPPDLIPQTKWDKDLVIVCSAESFLLASTHPLRRSPCLVCGQPINRYRVTIVGVAALTTPDDQPSGVSGDLFIAHSGHFPIPTGQLRDAVSRAL